MENSFEGRDAGDTVSSESHCPPPLVWYEIAAGTLVPERAYLYLEHASGCARCAAQLRESVADLDDQTSPSETQEIASFQSASAEWRQKLVHQIIHKSPAGSRWGRWTMFPRMALAAAAVCAIAVVTWVATLPNPLERTHQLLASAHSQKRTLQMRMSGMPYAPAGEGMQRKGESSFMDRPDALLQAEALIAKNLAQNPSNSQWLQAKGRADLMEGNYQGALESLRRANQLAPKSVDVLTDLAIASFQLGDSATAYERLSEALTLKPDDPMALFNRAVVGSELHLYHQALEDSGRYLRLDPNSKWADEMRELAERARLKLQQQEKKQKVSLLTPGELVQAASNADRLAEIDDRVEAYLKEAVTSWLPRAYPGDRNVPADPAARQALFFLADLTRQRHRDAWLTDLLQGSTGTGFSDGIRALAAAAHANDTADYELADRQAVTAERIFRQSHNRAGEMRAIFEEVFAAQLTRQSERCRTTAQSASVAAEGHSYPWLEIQFLLEHALCSGLMGDIGTFGNLATRAQDKAKLASYGELYLRSVTFAADERELVGAASETIQLANEGLERFWSGNLPPLRGYSLYAVLAEAARVTNRVSLRYSVLTEAVPLGDSDPDLLSRAMARRALADAAVAVGLPEVAQAQYAEAGRLLRLTPSRKVARTYELENEVDTAQLETRLGEFDSAIQHLLAIQDEIRSISNQHLARIFYSTLGELELGRHRPAEAEQVLRPALALAERNLGSIHSQAERMQWSKSAAPTYLAMAQAQLEQGQIQESLETFERFMRAARGDESGQPGARSLKQIPAGASANLNSRLPLLSQETVLAYGLLPGGVAIWVYDNRGIRSHWLPKANESIEELASRFLDMVSDATADVNAIRRDSHALYEALVAPVEMELVPERTLVIEAENPLSSLPFEALLDRSGHYMLERWTIVHSSGRESDRRHEDDTIRSDWTALIVGSTAAQPSRGILSLPNVAGEADAVASALHSGRVLKGDDATLGAVRSGLRNARVFHFAGHSVLTPDKTGLLLAGPSGPNGFALLDADTVRQMRLPNMQLAVLSACSTASGHAGADGFNSMTEAFLHAGVPHVVASRWAVDSVATRSYVQDFYRSALSGHSISDSIRSTSLRMLSDPRTSHPYFWSAFAAYGQP